jgi:hypothetical protein
MATINEKSESLFYKNSLQYVIPFHLRDDLEVPEDFVFPPLLPVDTDLLPLLFLPEELIPADADLPEDRGVAALCLAGAFAALL